MYDIIQPDPTKKCECPDCERMQSDIAYDRDAQKVYAVCQICSDRIVDRGNPEYHEWCPNCGCGIGIN